MSLHDEYARRTPFELAFPELEALPTLIQAIVEEAQAGGADPSHLHAFVTMGSVTSFVKALQGPEAPAEAIHQYGALVYQGVHFEEDGRPLYLLTTHASRYLVEGAPEGRARPPSESGYLQLPQHLFWIPGIEGSAPESVDGMFWVVSRGGLLHVLLVTGVRPDRPGFGTVPIPEAPIAEADSWLRADVRADGDDFASTLPGAEVDGLYAFHAAGEALKLIARFFAYLEGLPAAQGELSSPSEDLEVAPGAPPPSALDYRRIGLV